MSTIKIFIHNPCDAILCFYMLLGQRYIVNNHPQFNKLLIKLKHRELITNDNIFDLNHTIQNNFLNDTQ